MPVFLFSSEWPKLTVELIFHEYLSTHSLDMHLDFIRYLLCTGHYPRHWGRDEWQEPCPHLFQGSLTIYYYPRQHVSFCERKVLNHVGLSDVCLSWNNNFVCLLSHKGIMVPNFLASVRNIHSHSFIRCVWSMYYMLGNVCGIETVKSISARVHSVVSDSLQPHGL